MKDRTDGPYAWYVAGVLFFAYVIAYLDRLALTLLVPLLKADLHLSDTQVSLLQGFAFALFFAVAGLPLGKLADRWSRRNLLVAGLATWSVMTMLCGMASNFTELFLARVGVGIGEAALAPASYSLIADYFSREKFGRATSVMTSGSSVGNALSTGGAGLALALFPSAVMLPLIGLAQPWQIVFLLAGAPGLVIAAILMTVREPARRRIVQPEAAPSDSFMRSALLDKRAFGPLFAGFALHYIGAYAMIAWMPVVIARVYHMPLQELGYALSITVAAAGVPGYLYGGWLSDAMARRWPLDGRLRFLLFSYPVLTACFVVLPFISDRYQALAVYGFYNFISAAVGSVNYTTTCEMVPNKMKGQAVAALMLTGNLVGMGLSPTLVALATDYLFRDEMKLDLSVMIVGLPASLLVIAMFWLALAPYARCRERLIVDGKGHST